MSTGPNLLRTSFLELERRDHAHPKHKMSLEPPPGSPVHIIRQVMKLDQLCNLHVNVPFGILDKRIRLILVETSFVDKLVERIF